MIATKQIQFHRGVYSHPRRGSCPLRVQLWQLSPRSAYSVCRTNMLAISVSKASASTVVYRLLDEIQPCGFRGSNNMAKFFSMIQLHSMINKNVQILGCGASFEPLMPGLSQGNSRSIPCLWGARGDQPQYPGQMFIEHSATPKRRFEVPKSHC
jgi:hypothetical protein